MSYIIHNGKMVQQNHKYVVSIAPPPVEEVVQLIHTKTGSQSITLGGSGDVSINWGDGFAETVTLSAYPGTIYSHTYSGAGGTIEINHPANLTDIGLSQSYPANTLLTSANIPASAVNIQNLSFMNGSLSGTFITHPEWINLKTLALYNQTPGLTSINTYPQWTQLQTLMLFGNPISTINTFKEWINLETYSCYMSTPLADCSTFDTWNKLKYLGAGPGLTYFTMYNTWPMSTNGIQLSGNALPQNDIDRILTISASTGYANKFSIGLAGGTNAVPGNAGLRAMKYLIDSSGFTSINVNESDDGTLTSWNGSQVIGAGGHFTSSGTSITQYEASAGFGGWAYSNGPQWTYFDVSVGDVIRIVANLTVNSSIGPRLRDINGITYNETCGVNQLVQGLNAYSVISDTSVHAFYIGNIYFDPSTSSYYQIDNKWTGTFKCRIAKL
jgi:hypothetical protein